MKSSNKTNRPVSAQPLSSSPKLVALGILLDSREAGIQTSCNHTASDAHYEGSYLYLLGMSLASAFFILLFVLSFLKFYMKYDFEPILFWASHSISGKSTESCLDLPERIRQRISACTQIDSAN